MKTERHEKLILVDADVIFHLFRAERMSLLKELYEGRMYVLDMVVEELKSFAPSQLDFIIKLGILQEMSFPTSNKEILSEYNRLKKEDKGKGESACMAVCRYQKNIIASNNLKDIKPYCQQFLIEYLTTMDILAVGYLKGKLTVAEADYCIYVIKSQRGKLPRYDKIEDFIKTEFDKEKVNY
jgi:predicted nucleic acid-binding protein